jgi:hypothetical protein
MNLPCKLLSPQLLTTSVHYRKNLTHSLESKSACTHNETHPQISRGTKISAQTRVLLPKPPRTGASKRTNILYYIQPQIYLFVQTKNNTATLKKMDAFQIHAAQPSYSLERFSSERASRISSLTWPSTPTVFSICIHVCTCLFVCMS